MQLTSLASVCEILPGYPFRGKVPEAEGSDIRVVQIKDVSVELGIRCVHVTPLYSHVSL